MVTNKPTEQAEKVVDGLGLSPLIPLVVGPELGVPGELLDGQHILARVEQMRHHRPSQVMRREVVDPGAPLQGEEAQILRKRNNRTLRCR